METEMSEEPGQEQMQGVKIEEKKSSRTGILIVSTGPLLPYSNFLNAYNIRIINYGSRMYIWGNSTFVVGLPTGNSLTLNKTQQVRSYGRGWPSYQYVEYRFDRLLVDSADSTQNFTFSVRSGVDSNPFEPLQTISLPRYRGVVQNTLSYLCLFYDIYEKKLTSPTNFGANYPGDSTNYVHFPECPTLYDPPMVLNPTRSNMTFVIRALDDPFAMGEATQWSLEDLGYGAYILCAICLSISILLTLVSFCSVIFSIAYIIRVIIVATRGQK